MTTKNSTPVNASVLVMLLSLYIAQGLPVGFMTQALPALLRHYGVSLAKIGVVGVLMAPWAIKFLWAAWIDKKSFPVQTLSKRGHYRSWIVFTQSLMVLCVVGLAFLPMTAQLSDTTLWMLFVVLLLMNVCCATQDIATDALAVNVLHAKQIHWGNSFQVIGSRLGFMIGGGALLYAIDVLSWRSSFLLLALGIVVNSLSILRYHEPRFVHDHTASNLDSNLQISNAQIKPSFRQRLGQQYGYLWSSHELRIWLLVLVTHKCADGLSGPMIKPMMLDMGLNLSQIGIYITMIGASCALLGAWLAAVLIKRFSLNRMFLGFAILQTVGLVYYVVLANRFEQQQHFALWHLYIAHAIEETLGSMTLVALLSIVMQHARPQFAGHDFTLQVAVMTMVSGGLYLIGGSIAQWMGYYGFLCLVLGVSVLTILPKWYWIRAQGKL